MATEPGYDDPDDKPAKVCHRHPLGCPDRPCRVCRGLTAEKSSICLNCQSRGAFFDPKDGYLVVPWQR
jgi:hypothetical protein